MAVEFSALPSDFQSMYGEGLQLAGGSLLSRAAKTALKIGDAASLVVPEIAPAVQAAHIVKSALDGAGKKPRRAPVRRAPVRGKGFKSIANAVCAPLSSAHSRFFIQNVKIIIFMKTVILGN